MTTCCSAKVDPTTWRSYTVRLRDARTAWDIFDITLLRPAGWMAEHSRRVASRQEVWVDFEELNAKGWAEVIEERACPVIAEGPGRVITATITRPNEDVRTLTLTGGETLHVTGSHRMYSASRQDWVPVRALEIGEELRTAEGRKAVASLGFQRGRHKVYNIEVEDEHCYFVGNGEVLSHNACGDLTDTPKPKPLNSPNPEKWTANGGTVEADWTYADKAGNKVPYPNGHPDFKAGGHVKAEVEIQQKGNRTSDFRDATKANGGSKPPGTTWHHHENGTTMQAVDSKVHRSFTHRGGVSVKKKGKR